MVRFQIRLEKGRLESPSNARAGGRVTPTTSPTCRTDAQHGSGPRESAPVEGYMSVRKLAVDRSDDPATDRRARAKRRRYYSDGIRRRPS